MIFKLFSISDFKKIIELSSAELIGIVNSEVSLFTRQYSNILFYYLESRSDELSKLIEEIKLKSLDTNDMRAHQLKQNSDEQMSYIEYNFLLVIGNLRFQIRSLDIQKVTIQKVINFIDVLKREKKYYQDDPIIVQGIDLLLSESFFVLGMAYEIDNDQMASAANYLHAHQMFQNLEVRRKAVKSLNNYISCQTRIYPDRNWFSEYLKIVQLSLEINETRVAGTALTNIARDYQILKMHRTALKYAIKALSLLKKEINSYEYHFALLNKVHILCDLKNFELAAEDFRFLLSSPYPEVLDALKGLEKIFYDTNLVVSHDKLTPTWIERLSPIDYNYQMNDLSPLEEKLLFILSKNKSSKDELISKIYGQDIDYFSAEGRLKNLINRVRKRNSKLIIFQSGFYKLSDKIIFQKSQNF